MGKIPLTFFSLQIGKDNNDLMFVRETLIVDLTLDLLGQLHFRPSALREQRL